MNVEIIGGGPGGAYAALLLKRDNPEWDVTVYELNPADETYGWGIVLPEKIYPTLREADEPTAERMVEHRTTWDPIDTYHGGERIRCGGYPYTSLMRTTLLELLHDRCREVGVDLQFERRVDDPVVMAEEADLFIGADGAGSPTREAFADEFGPTVQEGRNYFSWFGTDAEFEALSHIYVDTDDGLWHAGAYPGPTSTFIVSCEPDTFERAGITEMSEEEYIDYLEEIFAEYLGDHGLRSKTDKWRNFRMVSTNSWSHGNVVLLGDAAHTAHFTIGSGTRMALEDAIAISDVLDDSASFAELDDALTAYETERRPHVETLQNAAWRSRTFFEHIDRYADAAPIRLAFLYLTRTGHNSYERVRERDSSFIERVERWFATHEAPAGDRSPDEPLPRSPVEQPFQARGRSIANRAVALSQSGTVPRLSGSDAPDVPGLVLLRTETAPDESFWERCVELAAADETIVGIELPAPVATAVSQPDVPVPDGVPGVTEAVEWTASAVDAGVEFLQFSLSPPMVNRETALNRGMVQALERIRETWDDERSLAAAVPATGPDIDETIAVGRRLGTAGVDLLAVTAGSEGDYTDPMLLSRYTGWIRYGTGLPAVLLTHAVDADEANTVLAGGQGDLCLFGVGEDTR